MMLLLIDLTYRGHHNCSCAGLNMQNGRFLSGSQASLASSTLTISTNPPPAPTTREYAAAATGGTLSRHRRAVQRSQSTQSKTRSRSGSSTAAARAPARMPSLDELEDGDCGNDDSPYENHSVIMEVREETAEESRKEQKMTRSRNAKDEEDGSRERRNKHKVSAGDSWN